MAAHPDDIRAGVGLHPSFCVSPDADAPHRRVSTLEGGLYLAFGEADPTSSVEHNRPLIEEAQKLGARAEVDVLPGASHGFAVPGPNFHGPAAARGHREALELIETSVR